MRDAEAACAAKEPAAAVAPAAEPSGGQRPAPRARQPDKIAEYYKTLDLPVNALDGSRPPTAS
jgi:hypothetical protein